MVCTAGRGEILVLEGPLGGIEFVFWAAASFWCQGWVVGEGRGGEGGGRSVPAEERGKNNKKKDED